jgi:hypothetical protein
MHASAAETGCLTRRIQSRQGRAVRAEHAAVEIGLDAAQRLARENVEPHRDERPRLGIEDLVRGTVRMSLSPRYLRAPRRAVTCMSLEKGCRSAGRARISRSTPATVRRLSPVSAFMRLTSVGNSGSTMKSSPFSMKARSGAGTPSVARINTPPQLFPVRSGFCSEPDRANSFAMIRRVRINHE